MCDLPLPWTRINPHTITVTDSEALCKSNTGHLLHGIKHSNLDTSVKEYNKKLDVG